MTQIKIKPHGSCRVIAPGEALPPFDQFMAMTIPMLFWAIGMLKGKHGVGRILFKRQAVHDAGQRWCDEGLAAAANGTGAWAEDWIPAVYTTTDT
jgi:hypothetical protein